MGSTHVDLVKDLKAKLTSRMRPIGDRNIKIYEIGINALIDKAKKGYYHDFASPYATPKIELHKDLLKLNLGDIDKKMQNGDYDDEAPTDKIKI